MNLEYILSEASFSEALIEIINSAYSDFRVVCIAVIIVCGVAVTDCVHAIISRARSRK